MLCTNGQHTKGYLQYNYNKFLQTYVYKRYKITDEITIK